MDFELIALLSLCIIVPSILALVRFSKINRAYYPFIFCLWAGTINEALSMILVKTHHTNVINYNIYLFIESLLLTWQFKRWNLFEKRKAFYNIIITGFIVFWVIENFIISGISTFNSYFRISYSTVITFMSISLVNNLIVTERRTLIKNPVFIICTAFIIFYTFSTLSEIFWVYGINENKSFRQKVFTISVLTNFIAIILYTFSILWMPIKQRFTLPSS